MKHIRTNATEIREFYIFCQYQAILLMLKCFLSLEKRELKWLDLMEKKQRYLMRKNAISEKNPIFIFSRYVLMKISCLIELN